MFPALGNTLYTKACTISDKPKFFPSAITTHFQRQIHSYLKWLPLRVSRPSVKAQYRLVWAPCWGVLMKRKKSCHSHFINDECRIKSEWTVPGWTEYVVTPEPDTDRCHVKKEDKTWCYQLAKARHVKTHMTPIDKVHASGDITRNTHCDLCTLYRFRSQGPESLFSALMTTESGPNLRAALYIVGILKPPLRLPWPPPLLVFLTL